MNSAPTLLVPKQEFAMLLRQMFEFYGIGAETYQKPFSLLESLAWSEARGELKILAENYVGTSSMRVLSLKETAIWFDDCGREGLALDNLAEDLTLLVGRTLSDDPFLGSTSLGLAFELRKCLGMSCPASTARREDLLTHLQQKGVTLDNTPFPVLPRSWLETRNAGIAQVFEERKQAALREPAAVRCLAAKGWSK